MLISHTTSNKRLGWPPTPPSILERAILDMRNLFSWKIVSREKFYKFQLKTVNECQTFPCRETVNITITVAVQGHKSSILDSTTDHIEHPDANVFTVTLAGLDSRCYALTKGNQWFGPHLIWFLGRGQFRNELLTMKFFIVSLCEHECVFKLIHIVHMHTYIYILFFFIISSSGHQLSFCPFTFSFMDAIFFGSLFRPS